MNFSLNDASKFAGSITQAVVTFSGNPSRIGVSGFIFDIIGNEEMALDSVITDHYTEDNKAIQDQIALSPEQFTLSGYVGELASSDISPYTNVLTQLQAFGPVPAMLSVFSNQAAQVYNRLVAIKNNGQNIINQAANAYSLFADLSTTTNKQQNAFQYFYALWQTRQLCEVETPWGIFEDMAILNVRAKQDETTRIISDFFVTFKKMRFAKTSTITSTGVDLSSIPPRARFQQVLKETPDNSGLTTGTKTSSTVLNQNANLLKSN